MFSPSLRCRFGFSLPAVVVTLVTSLVATEPASALNRHRTFRLANEAFGSSARALTGAGGQDWWIAGVARSANGLNQGKMWGLTVDPSDPTGNTVTDFPLPTPPGVTSEASGVALLEGDPDQPIICGTISPNSDTPRVVLWVRDASGNFTNTIFDDAAAIANSIATALTPSGWVTAVAGKYRLSNGAWHACVWKNEGNGFVRRDIGTLGGRNSEANSVAYIDDLIGWNFAGSSQRSNGRWVATLMEEEGIFYFIRALPTPAGSDSQGRILIATDGGIWRVAGDVTRNGKTLGNIWVDLDRTPLSISIPPPPGFANSTLRGIVVHGLGGNDTLAFGTAWNSAMDRTGMGALCRGPNFKNPIIFDSDGLQSRTQTVDKDETITIHMSRTEWGGASVGDVLPEGGSVPQAAAFLPTNEEVPDAYRVPVGKAIGGTAQVGVGLIWNEFGDLLQIRPARNGAELNSVIEFTSSSTFRPGTLRAPLEIAVNGRFMPKLLGGTTHVEVQTRSNTFAVWVTVGFFEVNENKATNTVVVGSPSLFSAADGGPIQFRLLSSASARNPGILAFDEIVLKTGNAE